MRTTRVRHPNGQLQIIRNGDIGSITNYSKQYIFAVVEVSVPYDCNLAHVYKVIEEVGEQLKENDLAVLEPTLVDGVESIFKYSAFSGKFLLMLSCEKELRLSKYRNRKLIR